MRRAWMTGISIGLLIASWASAAEPVVMTANGTYNVREAPFNAAGNGATDDTAAFQAAMNAAANDGGGVVTVPAGKYRIATHLTVPANVTLEGVWARHPMQAVRCLRPKARAMRRGRRSSP